MLWARKTIIRKKRNAVFQFNVEASNIANNDDGMNVVTQALRRERLFHLHERSRLLSATRQVTVRDAEDQGGWLRDHAVAGTRG
jgi:hypothetical protein